MIPSHAPCPKRLSAAKTRAVSSELVNQGRMISISALRMAVSIAALLYKTPTPLIRHISTRTVMGSMGI